MTVPNPTATPDARQLPMIEVRGATSRRRQAVVASTAVVPLLAVLVVIFSTPLDSPASTIAGQIGSPLGVGAAWAAIAVRAWPPLAPISRHLVATLMGVVWAAAAAVVCLVGAARTAWEGWHVAAIVVAGFGGLWLAWWAGGLRHGAVGPIVVPSPARASPTARTAWSGTSTHSANMIVWLVLAAVFGFFLAMTASYETAQPWMVVVVLAAITTAIPCSLRLTIDRRGLRVRARFLGIPLVTVPLDRVASAAAGIVEEGQWGNGSSVAERELVSIVHRSGPALLVTRTDGSMVVVSTSEPAEAAETLETLRAQAARARG